MSSDFSRIHDLERNLRLMAIGVKENKEPDHNKYVDCFVSAFDFNDIKYTSLLNVQCSISIFQNIYNYSENVIQYTCKCAMYNNNNDNDNGRNGSYFIWLSYFKWGRRFMVCNLLRHRGLILNKFRISNRCHILRRKTYQLPGWMKNPSYHIATVGIRTSDLPHSMTMSQKVPRSYPLGHRSLTDFDQWIFLYKSC